MSLIALFNAQCFILVVLSDITDIAIEWANKNVESNPHLSHLIEIRRAGAQGEMYHMEKSVNGQTCSSDGSVQDAQNASPSILETQSNVKKCYTGPSILLGVVNDGENFDFCMCNPPFFETMEEAGLNPKTSCGGTSAEMVCSGGEHAFITRIIEDSAKLKDTFRYYDIFVLSHFQSKLSLIALTLFLSCVDGTLLW